jgi:hypothetical protein
VEFVVVLWYNENDGSVMRIITANDVLRSLCENDYRDDVNLYVNSLIKDVITPIMKTNDGPRCHLNTWDMTPDDTYIDINDVYSCLRARGFTLNLIDSMVLISINPPLS